MTFDQLYRLDPTYRGGTLEVEIVSGLSIVFNEPDGDSKDNWRTTLHGDKTWKELFNLATLTLDEGQKLFNAMVSEARAFLDGDNLSIRRGRVTYREAHNFVLMLSARIECKGRKYRNFRPGDIVFPTFLDVTDGPAPEAIRSGGQIGIVIDTRGSTHVLVLWADSGNYSVKADSIVRVDYNMTIEEYDLLWDSFGYRDNWSKDRSRPICVMYSIAEKSKKPKSTPSSRMFRHYWELKDTVLQNGDTVVLFDKYILKVWQHRFEDTTTTDEKQMWWARRCAEYLGLDFDTAFFPTAERLGFYRWKDHPADKLRYQWQYTTYNNATAWALWMLAISDQIEFSAGLPNWQKPKAKEFWGICEYAIPNGMGNLPATASAAVMPSKYLPKGVPGSEQHATLVHPLNRTWTSMFHNLIPVFLSLEEYQNAQLFLNNKNYNTNVIQDQSPGSDQGRQTAEARRQLLEEAQTQDGSGYSGDRRSAGRSEGKTGSSSLSGTVHSYEHRFLCSKYREGDPGCEEGSSELRTGTQGPEGGVRVAVPGERVFDIPNWAITPNPCTCNQCLEESFFLESTSPGFSVTTEHYRCANEDCGYTDSFP